MRSADIILAMRASLDPERLAELRARRRDRWLLVALLCSLVSGLVLLATCG